MFFIDDNDVAVRQALILKGGTLVWPAAPMTLPAVPTSKHTMDAVLVQPSKEDAQYSKTLTATLTATGAVGAALALGAISPSALIVSWCLFCLGYSGRNDSRNTSFSG